MEYNFLKKNIFLQKYNKKFLTPKKIALLIASGTIFIGFIVISFVFLEINIPEIFKSMGIKISNQPFLVALLLVSVLAPFFKASFTIFYVRPAMKGIGVNVSWLEYVILAVKVFFFNTITPFASGGEPYVIYWIKSRGGTIKLASSLSLVSMIVGSIGQILITIPSFIIISIDYTKIIQLNINGISGMMIYWFVVCGLLLNVIILSIWVIMGMSKKFHYGCSKLTNWILKKFKRPYLSKEEMHQKYIVDAEFQEMFYNEMRKWKRNLIIALYIVVADLFLYITVFFSFALVSPNFEINPESFSHMFNITNVSLTANNFIPIPSGEGTIQITIGALSKVYFTNELLGVYNAIGFWKIITNYLPVIFCVLILIIYYGLKIMLMKKIYKKVNADDDNNILDDKTKITELDDKPKIKKLDDEPNVIKATVDHIEKNE